MKSNELLLYQPKKTATSRATPLTNSTRLFSVEITGVEGEILDNISTRLRVNLRPLHEKPTQEDIQNFYQNAPEEIKEALKPFGYFHPEITAHLSHQGKQWKAFFHIKPGKPIEVTDVHIQVAGEGANDPKFKALKTQILEKMGHTLNVKRYEDAKLDLFSLAEERGYFQANIIDSQMTIDLTYNQARLYILFNTGPRYRFGPVSFSPTPLSDRFLQRFVPFKVGEPFSEKEMERFQRNLSNSNYFQKISVKHLTNNSLEVPIEAKLKTKKARQYIIGGGWGTDTLARAIVGINFRYLNPQGHQLRTAAVISQIRRSARATYIIPGKNPVTDQYQLTASAEELDENSGQGHNQRFEASYLTVYKRWHPTFSVSFLNETFWIYKSFFFTPNGNLLFQHAKLLIPSFSVVRSYSDEPLQPTKGYQFNFTMRGGMGSHDKKISHNFFQIRADFKALYSLTSSQRIFVRGSLGKTQISNIFHLPLSLQYFAGGPQSVRGYRYLDIGPGKYFTVGSVELQQKIFGNIYLTGFYDVGSVNNQFLKSLKRSPGIGILYLSPIGSIEFAIAVPLDKNPPQKQRHFRFQFSMGSDLFGFNTQE